MITFDQTPLSTESADIVLQHWLGKNVKCQSIQRMHGGMVSSVLELIFNQPPYKAVIKISGDASTSFKNEAYNLEYLMEKTEFPVPKVYKCGGSGELIEQGFLLIERLSGINLGQAKMTASQKRDIDYQLADMLLELHEHKRGSYGNLDNTETYDNWINIIQSRLMSNFEDSRDRLTEKSLEIIPCILDSIPQIFSLQDQPTLIHGDVWETNVMVDLNKDRYVITGFIDPESSYADVEDELAYLEAFSTVTEAFFERYCKKQPLRKGYEIRKLYYWLNTMMLHVWFFGDNHYIMQTEKIAEKILQRT